MISIFQGMTKDGIPKPAWRAFQLLHIHAGDHSARTTVNQSGTSRLNDTTPSTSCALVPGTDFEGGDILPNSQPLVLPNAEACCEACQNHSGTSPETRCQLWSWASPKSSCCASRCYLKYEDGKKNPRKDIDFTSGYVGAAPPPPPPPGPKPQISALATVNGTMGDTGSLRIFLGNWANPDQDPTTPDANRTVKVTITHAVGNAPDSDVTVFKIGGGVCDPRSAWEAMGSPKTPTSSQLSQLMAASEWGTGNVTATITSPTTLEVTLEMSDNTAFVLAFSNSS